MMFVFYFLVLSITYVICKRSSIEIKNVIHPSYCAGLLVAVFLPVSISPLAKSFYVFYLFITFGETERYINTSRTQILDHLMGVAISGLNNPMFCLPETLNSLWLVKILCVFYSLYCSLYIYSLGESFLLWGKLVTGFLV